MDGTLEKNRNCDGRWINDLIGLLGVIFGSASSYLVALIVLLRLLMIRQPIGYNSVHETVSRVGCITIWVSAILICFIKFIVCLPSIYDPTVYNVFVAIQNFGLLAAPVLFTVILYAVLLCTLDPKTAACGATATQMKELAKMTYGVIIGLLVCNMPGLLYLTIMPTQNFNMQSITSVWTTFS